ncbi:double-stranded RNA-binding protein Staufen homolog 1 isoform X2 [Amblyraja radiata]|uniref:double-stranded RNA-binding protein Staufen homolog 1 isoform X2 n=1 Tax=Amblyraja radiata TaxID=386614 RepID=UPI00140385CD|nr:double-stranded RNA-binding protein Staufen homolog 1 isoform X2 [Amblyraja radiata]
MYWKCEMSQIQVHSSSSSLSQPLMGNPVGQGIPTGLGPLASENASRPIQSSALSSASATSTTAAAVPSNMANPKEKTPMCLVNELARFNKIQPEYKLLNELGPAHAKELEALDHHHFGTIDTDWGVYSTPLPEVDDRLLRYADIEGEVFTVQLTLGDQQWEAEGSSIKKAQHAAAAKALVETSLPKPPPRPPRNDSKNPDSVTPTVELNALCMKMGKKPTYRPIDPYPGLRPSYNILRNNAYHQRYFYPFPPVGPVTYQVELVIGNQQFQGKGRSRQAAKHDAAAKALKALQNEILPSKLPTINGKENDDDDLNKSEISQVFEIALKRNMPVNFEVIKESGPPHMKSFVTKVMVGEFSAEGEGKSKKISKKAAAVAVLEELKKLPQLPTVEKVKPRIKKKTKSIVKTSPEYGQGMNPISRLAQIQQAKKEKEPEYTLMVERGLPRLREFVMRVKVGGQLAEGMGPNKKVAKRNAAEKMLELLGFKVPQTQPPKPALKTDEKNFSYPFQPTLKEPVKGRKVTFFEPNSSMEDTAAGKDGSMRLEDEFRMPYPSHQQLPAGILPMVPEVAQAVGVNQGHHTKDFNRPAVNPAMATITAMIARELLYGGTSLTAETVLKNNPAARKPQNTLTRPSEQLEFLANVQALQVEYKDFPKNNKNEYVSLINCSSQPPLISHGIGKDVESCHDMAALNILKLLSELDQQNVEISRTGNGPIAVCVKQEIDGDTLIKPANSNTLGQTLDVTD